MNIVVPDYVPGTSLTAVRSFRWPRKDGSMLLQSISSNTDWPTTSYGGLVAECKLREPALNWLASWTRKVRPAKPCPSAPAPQYKCKSNHPCGIYAFKSVAVQAASFFLGPIVGEVQLGGRVYRYEKGYRAQYATISGIYDWALWTNARPVGKTHDRLAAIAEHYEVPLLEYPVPFETAPSEA